MPLYDMKCRRGHTFEAFAKIESRHSVRCPECGSSSTIQILNAPGAVTFRAGYYDNIDLKPVYCGTPQELRDACDKRGLYSTYLAGSSFKTRGTVQDTFKEIDNDAEKRQRAELR